MLTKTFSATLDGVQGSIVKIESTLLSSLPQIIVTGLPGEVIKESRERVRACLVNSGFDLPNGKVVLHLSPAEIKKQGSHYDLGIALSVLAAESKIDSRNLHHYGFLGELALDGTLCAVRGMLPLIDALNKSPAIQKIIIPKGNEFEGSLLGSQKILVAKNLWEVLNFISSKIPLPCCQPVPPLEKLISKSLFDQIVGQSLAKRALQIALAGKHHLLLVGPPGVGKSMLSTSALELLPPLSKNDFVDLLKIYSASSMEIEPLIQTQSRPFRAPHHSISSNALIGGGTLGRVGPGEISLAHKGLLFLDEFPEFRRDAIEGLREPLQSGRVHLTRVGGNCILPADFTLIAAMNPCPCGMYTPLNNRCRCTPDRKAQYQRKLSSPILDRISVMVQMNVTSSVIENENVEQSAQKIKESILICSEIQGKRFRSVSALPESAADMSHPDFSLDEKGSEIVKLWQSKFKASFRRVNQTIRVSRTIADLNGHKKIGSNDLVEAWGLRCFDFYQPF